MRRVVISAGDRVCEGQTLVELDNPEVEGQLRRARGRYDQALTSMLRSPANPALRAAVGEARVELAQLRDQLDALKLRSPIDATVVSVRAHEGGLVEASDIVATLAGTDDADGSRPYLVASFPNATLGLIEEGTELELIVDRAGPHRYVFVVRSVSHEAISVEDPRQRHELAPREGTDSVLVVEAELIDASASAQLNLFDGMVGEVRALVRKRSLLERVVEALGWRSGA